METTEPKYKDRQIRVFISSTFRDMQAERDYLVKFIFPQLRKLCESRGVTWGEVDLRWGVTDEQAAEGKVLPICLEEIKRCRPYFIGLLGDRYGWVPDSIPAELLEREPWLKEQFEGHKSVTELEILHGVLRDPKMAGHAYFYFRDPEYIKDKSSDFASEDEQSKDKLKTLKQQIRDNRFPVRENYPNPETLGALVLKDLKAVIDKLYPEDSQPDSLTREAMDHEAYAANRAWVYIGRESYYERLDKHADGQSEQPLVILGESGSGKSALLANWVIRYRKANPSAFIIQHYIGGSAYSADWAAMLRRIMGELKRRFDIQQDIPDKPDELRLAFANWLNMAAAKGKVVLILDALNQLEDRDNAPDLIWLPPVIPSNIRLIVSTSPGRPLDELKKHNWPVLQLKPLDADERRKLIVEFLKLQSRSLESRRVERIAKAPQSANPLYLRVLLDELRVFGVYEKLDERIDYYLSAQTVPQLYERILERYEQDYQRERPGLVKDAMQLVWASRRGLSEAELLEMLGKDGNPLPRAHWSPLYLAAEQSLVNRSGLIGFFHDYFREAVLNRYLPAEKEQIEAHLNLANYFEAKEINSRKIDELAWQLSQAKSWQRLYTLLSDLSFFQSCWNVNQFEVKVCWVLIEANSSFRMTDAYSVVLGSPQSHIEYVFYISLLFSDIGHTSEAFSLRGFLTEYCRTMGDKRNYSICLGNQALILHAWGQLEEAMKYHKQEEAIKRELSDKAGLSGCLGNQAVILRAWGQLEEAMKYHKQEEAITRELGDKAGLSGCLGNQALILRDWGQLEEAMKCHKQQEALCKELGDKAGLSGCLGNQALILHAWGQLEEAMKYHKQTEALCRELGYKAGLSDCLGNQALILRDWGQLEEAMKYHKQVEAIKRELGDKAGLSRSLGNQALILHAWGQIEEAMKYHKQEETLCKELGNKAGLSGCLGNQANVFYAWGQLEEAMKCLKQQEALCKELGDKAGLSACFGNQALMLRACGQLEEAMKYLKQQEALCKELGDKAGLSACLGNQANVLRDWGQLEEAMKYHKQEETLCKELSDKAGLSRSLRNQAVILRAWGQLEEAMKYHKQEEALCRELSDKAGLSRSLCGQANIFYTCGQLEEAMRYYKQQEALCKELGNKAGLSGCLGNQANVFYAWGQLEEAMKCHKQTEALCKELGDKAVLSGCLGNQALILRAWGQLDEAMKCLKQQEALCKELGNKAGLSVCLGNQALILGDWGQLDEAMKYHKQTEALKRELGDKVGLARSLINQASLLSKKMERSKEGLPLAEEAYKIAVENGLKALAGQIKPMLDAIRAAAEGSK
jgi:nephrocystin-3